MFLTSYIFKSKAVRALKGNWQTALIVSFIAGLPATILLMLSVTQLPVVPTVYDLTNVDAMMDIVNQIPTQTIWLLALSALLSFIVSPVLAVGSNYYFIRRLQGEDLGVMGVLSRRKIFLRSFLLALQMIVRTLLWGCLFIIPGYIASLRYAMAPYYLAENPELTPSQAIAKSKQAMADKKMSYFILLVSFLGWLLMANAVQIMLLSFGPIIAMVAAQFVELFRITYTNAAVSAFYLAVSHAGGIADAKKEADSFMRQIGARMPSDAGGPEPENPEETEPPEDAADEEDTK